MRAVLWLAVLAATAAWGAPKRRPPSTKPAAQAVPAPPAEELLTPLVPQPAAKVAPTPPVAPPRPEPVLFVAAHTGASIPFFFLRPGWDAGVEVRGALWLGRQLSVSASLRASQNAGRGTALIPGRGQDEAFLQNRLGFALTLGAEYALSGDPLAGLSVTGGYSVQRISDGIVALGTSSTETGIGHAVTAGLVYRLKLGPGAVGARVAVSYGGVRLGPLARYGTESLTGAALHLSYDLPLPSLEERR